MRLTAARAIVRALEAEGIAHAFGIPGTHNIELYDALAASEQVRPVLVTDEQSAGFMADGYWRASGRLACVNVVPGAGLTHALSGIAEAHLDNVPMLVLACGIRRQTDKAFQLHDVDQASIAAPIVKATLRIEEPEDAYRLVRSGCELARAGVPGPVMVEVPADHYLSQTVIEQRLAERSEPDLPALERDSVLRALEILEAADRPLLYTGFGAAGASDLLVALAERLEAPVATTIQGKGVFPESHPLALWPGFGDAAPPFARRVAESRDATLALGCRFSEVGTGSYGLRPPGPLVHVDIDPAVPGRNYETAVSLVADARAAVEALLEVLSPREPDAELRARIAAGRAEAQRVPTAPVDGVSPSALFQALQKEYPEQTVYAADSGNGTFLAMEWLRLEAPGRFLAPVDYSCMGYAVPAAIGASLARPGVPVVSLPGDGAFLMTGLELLTAARERTATTVLVLRDRQLAQISQFQDIALGRRTSSAVPDYDLESLAAAVGVEFRRLESNDDLSDTLRWSARRTAEGRPVLAEVTIDYSERTFFTRGVVRTAFGRLPWADRLRFVSRALGRRVAGKLARSEEV